MAEQSFITAFPEFLIFIPHLHLLIVRAQPCRPNTGPSPVRTIIYTNRSSSLFLGLTDTANKTCNKLSEVELTE